MNPIRPSHSLEDYASAHRRVTFGSTPASSIGPVTANPLLPISGQKMLNPNTPRDQFVDLSTLRTQLFQDRRQLLAEKNRLNQEIVARQKKLEEMEKTATHLSMTANAKAAPVVGSAAPLFRFEDIFQSSLTIPVVSAAIAGFTLYVLNPDFVQYARSHPLEIANPNWKLVGAWALVVGILVFLLPRFVSLA